METKNISGKIPFELHQRMWEELERTGMKVSDFLEKVIEEHFIKQEEEMRRKQESNEVTRTLAISVPDSFFKRYQRCLEIEREKHEGRYTNKDFLTDIIRKKMEEIELEAGISQDSQKEPESMVEEKTEESAVENPAESIEQEVSDMSVEMETGSEVSEEANPEETEEEEVEEEVEAEEEAEAEEEVEDEEVEAEEETEVEEEVETEEEMEVEEEDEAAMEETPEEELQGMTMG